MSLTLTLVPLAIAINMSLAASAAASIGIFTAGSSCADLPCVETIFMDGDLLAKTMREHGLHVKTVSENEYTIETESGILHYFRASGDVPFMLEVTGVKDLQELLDSLDSLENEYGRNVQKFTYDKVMCSLAEHGMGIESEEVLEDDSILLTLNV